MTQDEIKILSDKIANGTITPEEKLGLLKEMNAAVEGMKSDFADLRASQKIINNL